MARLYPKQVTHGKKYCILGDQSKAGHDHPYRVFLNQCTKINLRD
ncbi:hypothetical protein [Coleofasciculus sp.]